MPVFSGWTGFSAVATGNIYTKIDEVVDLRHCIVRAV